jgi:hypothetical protein
VSIKEEDSRSRFQDESMTFFSGLQVIEFLDREEVGRDTIVLAELADRHTRYIEGPDSAR